MRPSTASCPSPSTPLRPAAPERPTGTCGSASRSRPPEPRWVAHGADPPRDRRSPVAPAAGSRGAPRPRAGATRWPARSRAPRCRRGRHAAARREPRRRSGSTAGGSRTDPLFPRSWRRLPPEPRWARTLSSAQKASIPVATIRDPPYSPRLKIGKSVSNTRPSSLRDYVQTVRRRKWLVLALILVIPAAAVAVSLQQPESYRATAEVLLNREDLSAALSGTPDTARPRIRAATRALRPTSRGCPRSPTPRSTTGRHRDLAREVPRRVGGQHVARLRPARVRGQPQTGGGAQELVNAYARAFVAFRRRAGHAGARARRRTTCAARLRALEEAGDRESPIYRSLDGEGGRAPDAPGGSDAARDPRPHRGRRATKTQPKPLRNGLLALVLAIGLGVALAFLVEALDTRVGSAVEIAEALKLPLLARLPRPPRHVRQDELVMLAEPDGPARRGLPRPQDQPRAREPRPRRADDHGHARCAEEGKSTTIANLGGRGRHGPGRRSSSSTSTSAAATSTACSASSTGRASATSPSASSRVTEALVPIELSSDGTEQSDRQPARAARRAPAAERRRSRGLRAGRPRSSPSWPTMRT